ncbi:MAG: hypothetical protein MPJ50_17675 [Pirellulales bacterium]|nr:hypothetical protein [Pirellulales bacterium]
MHHRASSYVIVAVTLLTIGCGSAAVMAQERIYGAAIQHAESYPRGEAQDQAYEDYWSATGQYPWFGPFSRYGSFWNYPRPWMPLAPRFGYYPGLRYAPFLGVPAPGWAQPIDAWPGELGGIHPPVVEHAPAYLPAPAYELPRTGPRRLFW